MSLYLSDPSIVEFTTQLTSQKELESGLFEVILDESYFYPTSGGQPYDLGWLNDAEVVNVFERDGVLVHYTNKKLDEAKIQAKINESRRKDHCQQHSGQHLLSRVLEVLFEAETISFHLGEDYCSIDLDSPILTQGQQAKAEHQCQELIEAALPVTETYGKAEDWEKLNLRKQPKIEGEIRIISLGNFDACACCGTHVKNTQEILTILLLNTEKIKNGSRLFFLCGGRAIRFARKMYRQLSLLQNGLQTNFDSIPDEVQRLQDKIKFQHKTITQLEKDRDATLCEAWTEKAKQLFEQVQNKGYVAFCESKKVASTAAEALLKVGFEVALILYQDRFILVGKESVESIWENLKKTYPIKGGGRNNRYEGGGLKGDEVESILKEWPLKLNKLLS